MAGPAAAVVLLLIVSRVVAAPAPTMPSHGPGLSTIAPHAEVLQDSSGRWRLADVTTPDGAHMFSTASFLRAPEAFARASEDELFVEGIYVGALVVMVFYHLLVLFSVRDMSYLYYSLFIAFLALSELCWEGLAFQYLWPRAPGWNRMSLVVVDALAALSAIQFTRAYLSTRTNSRRFDWILIGLAGLALVAIPAAAGAWELAIELVGLVSLAGPAFLLTAGVICLRKGFRPARWYLLAESFFYIATIADTAASYGWIPSGIVTDHAMQAGSLLMVVLFSFGLTDRYNTIRQEKERVQAENIALQILSTRDGLTGVANRRRFDEFLVTEWKRSLRQRSPLAVILVDVDFFKTYNDTYGHQAGDDCLRRVAGALNGAMSRPTDLVARYGGEEFAAILPGVDSAGAHKVAEAMRLAVESLGIEHRASRAAPHVTISLGIACVGEADPASNPESIVPIADHALYEAKRSGRNRAIGPASEPSLAP